MMIGTRKSALALRQTQLAAEALARVSPGLEIQMETFHTMGDRILEKPLQDFGGKGVFVTELEQAILEGRMDLAVHSAKDMPMDLMEGLDIVGVMEREDPRDVLVTMAGADWKDRNELIIGTSSPRRQLQILRLAPELFAGEPGEKGPKVRCQILRGNVQTRLKKLEEGLYHGIILAAAGLKRLGLLDHPEYEFRFLECSQMIPAGGQGILAIEGKPGTAAAGLCARISHPDSWISLRVERRILRLLNAGCHEPIGVYCQVQGEGIQIQGISQREGRVCHVFLEGEKSQEEELALKAAKGLMG